MTLLHAYAALLQATTAAATDGAAQAPAGAAQEPAGGLFSSPLVPMVICMAVFYVFMILLPERKNRKKREEMLKNMSKGTKVMTTSGMYATVAQIQDQVVTLQIAEGVRARFALSSVQNVIEDDKPTDEKAS